MKRRDFVLTLGVSALLAAPLTAEAQQSSKVLRIGVLHPGSSKEAAAVQREPLERGLRELGWTPHFNILIDYRYAEGHVARMPELAADLVRSGVDVIVACGAAVTIAAHRATTTVPIVMSAWVGDPVADGVVKSLTRPGRNVTGLLGFIQLDDKRLDLLKEAFPGIGRVGVLVNPATDAGRYQQHMTALHASARRLNLQVEVFEVRRREEIAEAFAAIGRARVDALLVRGDPQVLDLHQSQIVAMVAKQKLPTVYWWRFIVEEGGLMSYGENLSGIHHRSASYVNRILKGAKPGELPIEQPTKLELAINVAAAKAQGLTIPASVLFRADQLIQ